MRILRKWVPLSILRPIAVRVNQLKINTVDKFIFRNANVKEKDFLLYRRTKALPELKNIIESCQDNKVKTGFRKFLQLKEQEYILHYKEPCIIEPRQGWAISGKRELINFSLANADAGHLKKPSLKYLSAKQKKIIHLEKAISLRDTSERAYFHFYNDVIAKIPFLLRNGADVENTPLIIAHTAYNKPFFQEILQSSSWLSSLKWIVQEDQVIQCDEVIFCRPRTLNKENNRWIVDQFNITKDAGAKERIFINRDPKRLRYISNLEEIIPVLKRYNFNIVDTDTMTVQQQAALIQGTKFLAGIHGAGLTNMIFKTNGPMQVLEIFPPVKIVPYHYAIIAKRHGFNYSAISGKTHNTIRGSFTLDPVKLEKAIIKILND